MKNSVLKLEMANNISSSFSVYVVGLIYNKPNHDVHNWSLNVMHISRTVIYCNNFRKQEIPIITHNKIVFNIRLQEELLWIGYCYFYNTHIIS